MLIGYARVSKADGSQTVDLQVDALKSYGVNLDNIYSECISGAKTIRPEFEQCIKSLRKGDTLVVWMESTGTHYRVQIWTPIIRP